MILKTNKTLTITIEGDEIETLKSAIKKVVEDINRIGLKHLGMTNEESDLVKTFNDKLHE